MEGFSLPIVKAAICRCPVLASSCAAHAELIQDPEALFPATSVAALTDLLQRIIEAEGWRESLIDKQLKLSDKFDEQAVGQRFWSGIADGLQNWRSTAYVHRGLRPHLAILSPCTPDPSGVARFTQATLRALGTFAEIDLYTNTGRPLTLPADVRDAGQITAVPYYSNRYNAIVAVLADSSEHLPILDLFEQYGGPAILHDSTLMHLYLEKFGLTGLTQAATRFLARAVSDAEVGSWLHNENPKTGFIESILERVSPLFVHTKRFRDQLMERFGFEAQTLVFPSNHGFRAEELIASERRRARQRLGIPDTELVIAHFGYATHSKAPAVCISAIAELRKANRNAHMYFVGSMKRWPEGQHWIQEQGYGCFVHSFGDYLIDSVYKDFLLAADCGLQLRLFDFGQPSAGLVDCVSAGMPCVTTESLAASCDCPNYVRRIENQLSPKVVAQALADCLAASDRSVFEKQRQAFVQEHNFSNYAQRIIELLGLSETL